MVQFFMHGQQGIAILGGLENNGLTSSLSISVEDNSGTLSEPCLPPLFSDIIINYVYHIVQNFDGIY